MYFRAVTDSGRQALTFPYPLPDMTFTSWDGTEQTNPGTDAIVGVNATVHAMVPTDGYDGGIRALLENLGDSYLAVDRFLQGDRIEQLRSVPAQWPNP
jgi:hypothetical protein